MAKTDSSSAPAPGSAWAPKVGGFAQFTEVDQKTKSTRVCLIVVTAIGSQTAPQLDDKGKPVLETVNLPVSGGKTVARTRNVMTTVATYDGILLDANRQLTEPRKGVLIGALSPLEV